MRIILQKIRKKCTQEMWSGLKLLSLFNRRQFFRFVLMFEILNNLECPRQLKSVFRLQNAMRNIELHDKTRIHLPQTC